MVYWTMISSILRYLLALSEGLTARPFQLMPLWYFLAHFPPVDGQRNLTGRVLEAKFSGSSAGQNDGPKRKVSSS